jgi:hypothetical protein
MLFVTLTRSVRGEIVAKRGKRVEMRLNRQQHVLEIMPESRTEHSNRCESVGYAHALLKFNASTLVVHKEGDARR